MGFRGPRVRPQERKLGPRNNIWSVVFCFCLSGPFFGVPEIRGAE